MPPELAEQLRAAIRDYPDFPRPGILFRDLVPVFAQPALLARTTRALAAAARRREASAIAGIESRGFLFGTPVALELRLPFIPIRKRGKLPGETVVVEYALEYGTAHLELQRGAIRPGEAVFLIDDLLATGGTAEASAGLLERLGAEVAGMGFVVELRALAGRSRLKSYTTMSLLAL